MRGAAAAGAPDTRSAPDPLATAATTGGAYGLLRVRLLPEDDAPMLAHHGEDRSFVVLAGRALIEVGDEPRRFLATTGDLVFVPRGWTHRCVAQERPADLLLLFTPGGAEGLHLAAWPPGADPDLTVRLAAEYNVDVLVRQAVTDDGGPRRG
ncbi:cupin domain-containing protein [Frankia sp. CNm7]|uniref:Cupin domain-containing protein n=1 Tax=Frankia nepalensis TaxID=1836974 RepID=A0A937R8F2_9ACTN|nr:cupin domain-containing protein [Frankia nepalensis]MBL7512134.1 cupin domain-containing protein [Frankia nepalensis]MBL7520905.1 cupin domain-containing protein [Frankia nepalensis]MBL7627291.1 cupin domain-containing protein [Frankia nepalensis]